MRAYELREETTDYSGLAEVERERPSPGDDEALVRVRACSINHHDRHLASADMWYPDPAFPVVPLSEAAGEVVEVGDDVERLAAGDRVLTPHSPDWVEGAANHAKVARTTGTSIRGNVVDGVLAEFVTFPAGSLARLPANCSFEQGATLPCAGLTAWRALVENGGLASDDDVLALGTGGVSTFALQVASMHGARTVVTSASDGRLSRAEELGAWGTVNYEETTEWGEVVHDLTGGVDQVVEVGGAGTLEQSFAAAGFGAHVHHVGTLAGQVGELHPAPLHHKDLTVEGFWGAGSRAMLDRFCRAVEATDTTPVVDRTFDFGAVQEAFRYVEAGEHVGKVAVTLE